MIGRPETVGPGGPVVLPDAPRPGARSRSVCIVLLSGIGDVVHGLPLAIDIKRIDPAITVHWVAEPAPAEVLRHHPAVDHVTVYRSRAGVAGLRQLRHDLAGVRTDLTLNAQRYVKSVWPTLLSGAPARVGLPRSKTRDAIFLAHTHMLEEGPWKHTQDIFLDFRWALGVEREAEVRYDLTFSDEERREQTAFFERLGPGPVAGLVLGSANQHKDWPAQRYAELADALEGDFGFRVLLLGGPSERERAAARLVAERSRAAPVDCLGDGVRRLMGLVAGCDLLVAPDTGPLHIARALGVPVIGLFGHTNPWRVGPYRRFHDLVVDRYTDPGDVPDPSEYLPRADRMAAITVADVLQRVEVAVSRYL